MILLLTAVGEAVTSTNYTHWDGKNTLADDYIPKPIDLEKLMGIVKDYLGLDLEPRFRRWKGANGGAESSLSPSIPFLPSDD